MLYDQRLVVAGVKFSENIIHVSAPPTAANPEYTWDFDANGPITKFMQFSVTAMISGLNKGFIFGQKQAHIIQEIDIVTNGLLVAPISETYGAYNRKCVVDMDGRVAFMGQKRLMPISLVLTPDNTQAPFLDEFFDERLRPWLETHDPSDEQEDAFLKWDSAQKILKIGAVVDGALQTYFFDPQSGRRKGRSGAFGPKENRNIGDSTMFLGRSYFGHRDNGILYEDDIGRTNDGISIGHKWSTGRIEYDKGREFMQCRTFEYSGWLTEPTSHILRVYIDGSATASFEQEYEFDDLEITSDGTSLGERGFGVYLIGGGEGTVFVFAYKNNVLLRGLEGEDFRFEWEVSGEGHFFQTNTLLFKAFVLRRTRRIFT